MKHDVILQVFIDKRHSNMLGVIPSTYDLGRMYENNATRLVIKSVDKRLDLQDSDVYLRFISGNTDLGKVAVFPKPITIENSSDQEELIGVSYIYDLGMMYTKKDKLQVQLILDFEDGSEVRSNIINFNLQNSLPLDKEFYLNLSYLDRLVCDKTIRIGIDCDDRELIIMDESENELCRIDVDNMLPKEWW